MNIRLFIFIYRICPTCRSLIRRFLIALVNRVNYQGSSCTQPGFLLFSESLSKTLFFSHLLDSKSKNISSPPSCDLFQKELRLSLVEIPYQRLLRASSCPLILDRRIFCFQGEKTLKVSSFLKFHQSAKDLYLCISLTQHFECF